MYHSHITATQQGLTAMSQPSVLRAVTDQTILQAGDSTKRADPQSRVVTVSMVSLVRYEMISALVIESAQGFDVVGALKCRRIGDA